MKTLTFVKKEIDVTSIPRDNPDGLLTSIFLPEEKLNIHNVCRPCRSSDDSWIHHRLHEATHDRTLLCGDFNRIGLQDGQDTKLLEFLMSTQAKEI